MTDQSWTVVFGPGEGDDPRNLQVLVAEDRQSVEIQAGHTVRIVFTGGDVFTDAARALTRLAGDITAAAAEEGQS